VDALRALYQRRRDEALIAYRFDLLLYVTAGGGKQPPKAPKILKENP